jgi:hypothetical protein
MVMSIVSVDGVADAVFRGRSSAGRGCGASAEDQAQRKHTEQERRAGENLPKPTDIQDHNGLLKVMYVNSWQQPPEHKGDVDADGVEGEAEHDRPNVAAYWANIIAAGHRCRLALIRASSVLAVASTLVAEAAISLNLAGCNDGWRGWRKDSARGRHAVGGN